MDDLLSEFLTETNESLDTVDVELVRLEQNPNDKAVLDNIFRLVHTIKGTCGFLGLPRLEAVAHAAENVLGRIRDGELTVTPAVVTLILESLDCIKVILRGLETDAAEPEGDDSELIQRLDWAAEGKTVEISSSTVAESKAAPEMDETSVTAVGREETEKMLGRALKPGEVSLEELEAAFANASGPDESANFSEPVVKTSEPVASSASSNTAATKAALSIMESKDSGETSASKSGQNIRVSVDLLEGLMTLVSELVLTRNQLLQIVRRHENSDFSVPLQRLSQCTTELQEGVMKTRMQPIGNAWSKLPRIVRDLCVELNKKIDLDMRGAETELDRQILELIKDPLTHMVRNSADHGIEKPGDRVAVGKPETGRIQLNAFHQGGHIIIELVDDGRGINVERLKQKIVENGLAQPSEVASMMDNQIQKYIFHPGLSTAEQVTSVSGRGVGMDVVRSNIEKIGGTIDLESRQGQGTKFSIKIPLTLAIVPGLIVEVEGERFAIPQISVLELVRVSSRGENRIETINHAPVLRLRNRLLPLAYLNNVLRFDENTVSGKNKDDQADKDSFVVVTQVGSFTFGIIVDQVFDTEEIVVKPVSPVLKNLTVYSGTTILGDGSVIMILDPNGVAAANMERRYYQRDGKPMDASEIAAIMSSMQDEEQSDVNRTRANIHSNTNESMLVFRAGTETPKAVPLALVARLEEIGADQIEYADGKPVVQYRGSLMPLVTVDANLPLAKTGKQAVLVFADNDRSMGLAVDRILDIVEADLNIELNCEAPGRLGTAVVDGAVTEVVDVGHYMKLAFTEQTQSGPLVRAPKPKGKAGHRLLLVDDSTFFRNLLKPLLQSSGYEVTTVSDATAALKLRDEGAIFDLIISDIDMPGLSGFEFAEEVRGKGRWSGVPLVALSALASPADLNRGREAGFNDYVAKHDRDSLLTIIDEQLELSQQAVA